MPEPLVEYIVSMPIVNPCGGTSRSFTYYGRIDWLLKRLDETGKVVDYKFSGDPHRFLQTKRISYQLELYTAATQYQEKVRIDGWEYRFVTTPNIKIGKMKKYPTFDAFEKACDNWLAEPGKVFAETLPINPARILQARHWMWDSSKRILDCRRYERWLHNSAGCHDWNRECPYMPLCLAAAEGGDYEWVVRERYQGRPELHPELSDLPADDKSVLTYTSLSTLAQCEMKYYWRFERCIEPQHEETGDALWLGSAGHVGMQTFATDGLDVALKAIDEWAEAHPALGDGFNKTKAQACKARACVRSAAKKWGAENDETTGLWK